MRIFFFFLEVENQTKRRDLTPIKVDQSVTLVGTHSPLQKKAVLNMTRKYIRSRFEVNTMIQNTRGDG
jgi:hypothetical protein